MNKKRQGWGLLVKRVKKLDNQMQYLILGGGHFKKTNGGQV